MIKQTSLLVVLILFVFASAADDMTTEVAARQSLSLQDYLHLCEQRPVKLTLTSGEELFGTLNLVGRYVVKLTKTHHLGSYQRIVSIKSIAFASEI